MAKNHNIRGRLAENAPNPVDVFVGQRIRLLRRLRNITQQEMAIRLGLTFQQIQKYESGQNRISSSRLWDIAKECQVGPEYFFVDMPKEIQEQSPRFLYGQPQVLANDNSPIDKMNKNETMELVEAYYRIHNLDLRSGLLQAVIAASKNQP